MYVQYLNFGSPAWSSAITDVEVKKIERVQKLAIRLIYGKYKSYTKQLKEIRLETTG